MPTETYIDCWNCGKAYEVMRFEHCPLCGEYDKDDPSQFHVPVTEPPQRPYLLYVPDMSPIFFEETPNNKRDMAQSKAASKKFKELSDTGQFPELIFVRSYEKGHRGWTIEFSHRTLGSREYLLAPSGLKLAKLPGSRKRTKQV